MLIEQTRKKTKTVKKEKKNHTRYERAFEYIFFLIKFLNNKQEKWISKLRFRERERERERNMNIYINVTSKKVSQSCTNLRLSFFMFFIDNSLRCDCILVVCV